MTRAPTACRTLGRPARTRTPLGRAATPTHAAKHVTATAPASTRSRTRSRPARAAPRDADAQVRAQVGAPAGRVPTAFVACASASAARSVAGGPVRCGRAAAATTRRAHAVPQRLGRCRRRTRRSLAARARRRPSRRCTWRSGRLEPLGPVQRERERVASRTAGRAGTRNAVTRNSP